MSEAAKKYLDTEYEADMMRLREKIRAQCDAQTTTYLEIALGGSMLTEMGYDMGDGPVKDYVRASSAVLKGLVIERVGEDRANELGGEFILGLMGIRDKYLDLTEGQANAS